MAGLAAHLDMSTVQQEVRLRVVIEEPQIPGHRVMAGLAIVAKAILVRIVLDMTARTVARRIREQLSFVAVATLEVVVFAEQREAGKGMIEHRHLGPARFRVTTLAILALATLVDVVILVAAMAGRCQRLFVQRFNVAVVAGKLGMRTG